MRKLSGLATLAAAVVTIAGMLPAMAQTPNTDLTGHIVWRSWKVPQAEGDALVAQFNKLYPNVDVEFVWQTPSDYFPALKLSMAAGDVPDVWNNQAGAMFKENAPFAEDLRPYVEAERGSDWEKDWYPAPLASGITADGQVLGLPFVNLGAGTIWYNKTQFDALGLTPPKTLEEWIDVNAKLRAAGHIPFVQGASEDWINLDLYMAIANQVTPGTFYKADAGDADWTDPGLVKSMDIWKSLFDDKIMQDGALGMTQYPDSHDLYSSQKASMIMQGTWNNNSMTQAGQDAFKTAYGTTDTFESVPFRFPDVNGDGELGGMTIDVDAFLMMSKTSQNKPAAWALISFLLSDDIQASYNGGKLVIPGTSTVALDPSLALTDTQRDALVWEAQLLAASTSPREMRTPETRTALGVALQEVASGQASSVDALTEVESVSKRVHHH
jgi:raffinose/stachyose/melibiose transport system substrate-binding protein